MIKSNEIKKWSKRNSKLIDENPFLYSNIKSLMKINIILMEKMMLIDLELEKRNA